MKGSDEREGGMGGEGKRRTGQEGRKAHGRYILCSCLHALRVLQKNGHLPTESHLFQEYAGYVVMTTVYSSPSHSIPILHCVYPVLNADIPNMEASL